MYVVITAKKTKKPMCSNPTRKSRVAKNLPPIPYPTKNVVKNILASLITADL
jgi:hypothetical protein